MLFEAQLGIKPSEWLKYAPLDDFLADNRIPVFAAEETTVSISGLHITLLRLIIASFLSIGAGILHRFVPTTTGRHIYSLATGFALLYYPFGNQVFLSLASCLLVYGTMLASPRLAGKLSWILSFGFMLLCMERTGDLWDTGAVDIIGSLMVIVLKQVAIAHNISDARSKRVATFSDERKCLLLNKPPTLLQYLSFMYAYGNLLAGPFNEYRDYAAFTERTGEWQTGFVDGMFWHAMSGCGKATLSGLASLTVNRVLEANFNSMMLVAPQVWQYNMGQRYAIAFITGFAKRCQYYFIWGISEAAMNASGFGFNGFTDAEKNVPKFDRYLNAAMFSVESCTSIAVIPRFWNINTGYFLRRYVYERWGGGIVALAATQMISGLWHGLREGHLFYFFSTIPMLHSSKVMYKQEGRLPAELTKSPAWTVAKWIMAHTPNNVFCQAFLLQRWELFWSAWSAFYFVPHIFVLFWCVVGMVIPTPKAYKFKAKTGGTVTNGKQE